MESDHSLGASEAKKAFGRALRGARELYGIESGQPGIGQEEFARMLRFPGERPGERYGMYERGEREPPLWVLAAIRKVTGLSLDTLVAGLPPGRFPPLATVNASGETRKAKRAKPSKRRPDGDGSPGDPEACIVPLKRARP